MAAADTEAKLEQLLPSGTITAADKNAIFAATGCTASARARNNGPRLLIVSGPRSQLSKALDMTLERVNANGDTTFESNRQSAASKERAEDAERKRLRYRNPKKQEKGNDNSERYVDNKTMAYQRWTEHSEQASYWAHKYWLEDMRDNAAQWWQYQEAAQNWQWQQPPQPQQPSASSRPWQPPDQRTPQQQADDDRQASAKRTKRSEDMAEEHAVAFDSTAAARPSVEEKNVVDDKAPDGNAEGKSEKSGQEQVADEKTDGNAATTSKDDGEQGAGGKAVGNAASKSKGDCEQAAGGTTAWKAATSSQKRGEGATSKQTLANAAKKPKRNDEQATCVKAGESLKTDGATLGEHAATPSESESLSPTTDYGSPVASEPDQPASKTLVPLKPKVHATPKGSTERPRPALTLGQNIIMFKCYSFGYRHVMQYANLEELMEHMYANFDLGKAETCVTDCLELYNHGRTCGTHIGANDEIMHAVAGDRKVFARICRRLRSQVMSRIELRMLRITIFVYCSWGKHRSVAVSELLYHCFANRFGKHSGSKVTHLAAQRWGRRSCGWEACRACDTMTPLKQAAIQNAIEIFTDVFGGMQF